MLQFVIHSIYSECTAEVNSCCEKLQMTDLTSCEKAIALCQMAAIQLHAFVPVLHFVSLFVLIQYRRKAVVFAHSVQVSYVKVVLCRCFAHDCGMRLHQHLIICKSGTSVIRCLWIYQLFSITQGQSACLVGGPGRCVYAWRLCLFVLSINVLHQLFIELLPLTELLR